MKNIQKARGLRRRCCKRVTIETQKARTEALKEEAEKIYEDILKLKQNKNTNIGCGFILTQDQKLVRELLDPNDSTWDVDEWASSISFFEATKYQLENWEK